MSKMIFGSIATLALVGVGYLYVSPAQQGDLDIPPVQTGLAPDAALSELQHLTYYSFLRQIDASDHGESRLRSSTVRSASDQVTYQLSESGQPLVIIRAKVTPSPDGKSLIDVTAEIPKNSFSTSSDLHPYDLKVLASMADLAATEYVDSVLNRKRMAIDREMENELRTRYGFDKNAWGAFAKRINLAASHAKGRDSVDPASLSPEVDSGITRDQRPADQAALSDANEAARLSADEVANPWAKP